MTLKIYKLVFLFVSPFPFGPLLPFLSFRGIHIATFLEKYIKQTNNQKKKVEAYQNQWLGEQLLWKTAPSWSS